MVQAAVYTAIGLLLYLTIHGAILVWKQVSKIKCNEEQDDLYNYLRSREFKESFAETVKKDTWERGLPMVYMNKDGWIVNHWKDGKIEKIKKVINI